MNDNELNAFYELIDGFDIVGSLTDDGKNFIKRGVNYLRQENQKLKEQKKDVIDYINYLAISISGLKQNTQNGYIRFNQTPWGKEIIESLGDNNE